MEELEPVPGAEQVLREEAAAGVDGGLGWREGGWRVLLWNVQVLAVNTLAYEVFSEGHGIQRGTVVVIETPCPQPCPTSQNVCSGYRLFAAMREGAG